MKRYDPGVRHAQKVAATWLETGEAGALTSARAVVGGGDWVCNADAAWIRTDEEPGTLPFDQWPFPESVPDTEEAHKAHFGLFDVCVHNVNLLRFLLGAELTVQAVSAPGGGSTALMTAGETPVTMTWGPMKCDGWYEETELLFERGYIKLLTPPPLLRNVPTKVEIYQRDKTGGHGTIQRPQFDWAWSFAEQARHFVDCVRDRAKPRTHGEDSLNDVRVLEAILEKQFG